MMTNVMMRRRRMMIVKVLMMTLMMSIAWVQYIPDNDFKGGGTPSRVHWL